MPIRHQFLLVNFYPRMDQFQFSRSEISFQQGAVGNRDNGLFFAVFNMDVRLTVFLIVKVVHENDNAVKH